MPVVELRAAPSWVVPPPSARGVPVKEIGGAMIIRCPEKRTVMVRRHLVGPARNREDAFRRMDRRIP